MAVLVRRHMHLYGTRREALPRCHVHACQCGQSPKAMHRKPLSSEECINARIIAEPLCLYDFFQETDGALAVITIGHAHGRVRYWGRAFFSWMGMPDEYFASAGNKPIADGLYEQAGITSADIDVALLYDHITPMSRCNSKTTAANIATAVLHVDQNGKGPARTVQDRTLSRRPLHVRG